MSRIDPADWKRVAPALDEALDLEGAAREDFVGRAFEGEPRLRALLRELIKAEDDAGAFLELPVALDEEGSAEDAMPAPEVSGYEIVRSLGRGGMGVVYESVRRLDDFEQRVALKVVRPDLDGEILRARFARERSILAALEHPNIARLLDGGTTDDGRSYFAMEYVEGTPLTRYADERRLTVDERLALFEQVGAAVAYAQQRLVVHRDLKPSNILVDENGRVKLLDFGIARFVESEGIDASATLTREGARVLTPEYAAPEQIRGERSTTATDVYAMGVILFELLAGRHPYGDSREGAYEFAYSDRDSESLERAVDATTGDAVVQARKTNFRALRRRLRGDLANVTAKALHRDPDRRYPSASALMDDLAAYREGRPVAARSPAWSYRASKAFHRHRAAFVAGGFAIVALVAGTVTSTLLAREAQREADRSERAIEFLVRMFEDTHPDQARGADWTATELLERGADRLASSFADDPVVLGQLERTLGAIQLDRGDFDGARALLGRALGRPGLEDPKAVRLAIARVEVQRNAIAEAESVLTTIDEATLGPDQRGDFLESMASLRRQQARSAVAESLSRVASEISLARYGETSAEYADDLDNLAVHVADQGRQAEAVTLHERSLAIRREVLPDPHSDLAIGLHNLAYVLDQLSRSDEAVARSDEAIAMQRALYPEGHMTLARSLRAHGQILYRSGQLDAAERAVEEALAMTRAEIGAQSKDAATCWNELAIIAYYRGDLPTTRDRFEHALELYESELGPEHPETLGIANNLATVQAALGELEAAEGTMRDVLARRRAIYGEGHFAVAFSLNALGLVVRRQDRLEEAIELHRGALERYHALHGDEHAMVATSRIHLSHALRENGQIDEALEHARAALALRRAQLPEGHRDLVDAAFGAGACLLDVGRPAEALPLLEEAEVGLIALHGASSDRVALASARLGECLVRQGRVDEGRARIVAAVRALEAARDAGDRELRMAREALDRID